MAVYLLSLEHEVHGVCIPRLARVCDNSMHAKNWFEGVNRRFDLVRYNQGFHEFRSWKTLQRFTKFKDLMNQEFRDPMNFDEFGISINSTI